MAAANCVIGKRRYVSRVLLLPAVDFLITRSVDDPKFWVA